MNGSNYVRVLTTMLAAAVAGTTTFGCKAGDRDQPSLLIDRADYDSSTHMHNYTYVLTNPTSNTAPLDTLVLKLEPGVDVVTDFRSPPGWRAFYSAEKGTVMWGAMGYINPDEEDREGNVSPSDYAIQPGASLSGFAFKSFGPPGVGLAITQSYSPLYMPADEAEFEQLEQSNEHSTLPEDNGYRLSTIVPVPDADWTGNRRPSVDGFLVFANLQDKSTFTKSALIVLRLGSAGESVDPATLQVLLNGGEVTASFRWNEEFNGLAATFSSGVSPIRAGTNVLRTSVEGVVPGTTSRRATDTDRVTFEFTP